MTTIFACDETPGKLIKTTAKAVAPMSMTIEVQDRTSFVNTVTNTERLTTLGLCTSVQIEQQVAAQFQNTFDNTIYVTPFGDLPGTASISFIINASAESMPGFSGTAITDYFKYRLQPSYYSPALVRTPNIWLTVGGTNPVTLYGYLIGIQIRGSTGQSSIVEGTLSMKVWSYP